MNRRKSREAAMKLIFEMLIKKENFEEVFEDFKEHTDEDISELDIEYITNILRGVTENTEKIDNIISKYLINWKIDRLSKIDLSILRLAVYEITFEEEIPSIVSINEAIELAKEYSPDITGAFINGVLGRLVQETN
jgi:transcription antitermination protein NusB